MLRYASQPKIPATTQENLQRIASGIPAPASAARMEGLILNTSVTIGYDMPWRQVHDLLPEAAKVSPHTLPSPPPFVLQTVLNDFYVTYERNAFTDHPQTMPAIYSGLHQNIQEECSEAGVEIILPHYSQLREVNQTTIPEQYLPTDDLPPAIRMVDTGKAADRSESGGKPVGEKTGHELSTFSFHQEHDTHQEIASHPAPELLVDLFDKTRYIIAIRNICLIWEQWRCVVALVKKTIELDQEQINRIRIALRAKSEKEAINIVLKQFDTDVQLAEVSLRDAGHFEFEEV
jgi:hypothetical protein